MLKNLTTTVPPPPGSPRDRDNRYHTLLAGGAKTRLLEAFLDLRLPEILGGRGAMTAAEICRDLALDPHRGWKFLHLLAMTGLLDKEGGDRGEDVAVFRLSAEAKEYFGADGTQGYYFRDLVNFWRAVACLPFVDVLQGMELPNAVRWPPPNPEAAEHLELWMRVTADGAIATLLNSGVMQGAARLLDVGGGDGTIGCALAERYPELQVTVFNLPASAHIARRIIAAKGCADRVTVHEGDFLNEELPGGFDRVLFSRVLTDWTPNVCLMLFEKARRALTPDGRLVINEAFVDGNLDYSIAWEFRYIFYDTFGRAMFKPLAVYERLLADAGFEIVKISPMLDDAFYSVVEARPTK
jgi:predicted O-methyltransferase YrrM